MSRDYAELEREFIDGLAADTGRDLAAWMALIDGETFAHRNDMIDWLRQRGLTFAKASRLERIHHNGGRPLYGDKPQLKPGADAAISPSPVERVPAQAQVPVPRPVPAAEPLSPPADPPPTPFAPQPPALAPQPAARPAGDLTAFLARAKGYRPLAELLLRVVHEAVPATLITVHDTHADLAAPAIYGAVAVTAKDVRLALDLGSEAFAGDLKRLRLPGTPANLTHTLVINDARRVDGALRGLIAAAAARANS